jgi:adenylate kinase family enzyme
MKIAIIGKMGSGKSTFATKLGKALQTPVTHMDKIYHHKDWSHISRDELVKRIDEIMKSPDWIIDGNYQHTLDQRLNKADAIVFFDIPTILCILRVFKRTIIKHPEVQDKVDGLHDKVSWKLIKLVLTYKRNEVLHKLNQLQHTKDVFIVHNDSDAVKLISRLKLSSNPRS